MTSCVFSLFFLLSLCSSITADGPTGLKVRITDRVPEFLKDYGLKYLRELVNRPFQDFLLSTCHIGSLTFTRLDVDPNDVVVRFQQGSGLQFEFRNLNITAEIQKGINHCLFDIMKGTAVVTGEGVSVIIRVRLIQKQGRLSLEIPPGDDYCKTQADRVHVDKLGFVLNAALTGVLRFMFTNQFCPTIRDDVVPNVNTMLAGVAMTRTLSEDQKINLDYSLSGDVTVTSNSLDVPFTGVVYYGDTRPALSAAGVEPVFTESNLMAYVGISEDLFKSAGQALYNHGPFELTIPEINYLANSLLKKLGLPKGPVKVEFTGLPVIKINKDGISVNVKAIAQSKTKSPPPPLPVECQFGIKVNLNGRHLTLQSLSPKCKASPGTILGKVLVGIVKPILRWIPSIITSEYL
ncbi:phospholipid transfer protein-like [Sander vitreus]